MIEKLSVQNFKCIDSVETEFSGLNLLTGPNSTGKSTLIQALLLLAQCVKNKGLVGTNLINGEFVKLGMLPDIRNIYTNGKQMKISWEKVCAAVN